MAMINLGQLVEIGEQVVSSGELATVQTLTPPAGAKAAMKSPKSSP